MSTEASVNGNGPAGAGGAASVGGLSALLLNDVEGEMRRFRRLFAPVMGVVLVTAAGLVAGHLPVGERLMGSAAELWLLVAGLVLAVVVLVMTVRLERAAEASVGRLRSSHLGSMTALASAQDARDGYTADHGADVREMSLATGRALGMGEPELAALAHAALFHDIGKIGIPDSILKKPGPLDDEEWAVMKQHPVIGAEILSSLDFAAPALPIIRHEHERWDGTGYPDGLAGEQIPPGARVILVCDAFHAMTSDRPYRSALDADEAIGRLLEAAGTQFDPRAVEAFVKSVLGRGTEAAARRPQLSEAG